LGSDLTDLTSTCSQTGTPSSRLVLLEGLYNNGNASSQYDFSTCRCEALYHCGDLVDAGPPEGESDARICFFQDLADLAKRSVYLHAARRTLDKN
jgi:hypothetical protein